MLRERPRVVEIHQLGLVVELDRGQGQREAAPLEHARDQPLRPEARQLLDDRRGFAVSDVQAAVRVRVVVPAVSLVLAGEPERPVRVLLPRSLAPGEAAVEDHANESARSARIARKRSSTCPARIRSIGLRSPRLGLTPKSHERAVAGS